MEALKVDVPHIFVARGLRWTAPPNWPAAPAAWAPPVDWRPEPRWGPPPPGWAFLRVGDCAADAHLPLEYREPEIDEKFRGHIADDRVPATAFATFLGSVVDIVSAAFRVAGAAGRAGSDYRDAALRSVRDATKVLDRAARADRRAPFVFFACAQDALSAVRMFAAAADRCPDDGLRSAGIAAFTGAGAIEKHTLEPAMSERLQDLFQTTSDRVMSVMRQANHQAEAPGRQGRSARAALGELAEITRLVSLVHEEGWMNLAEGLKVLDELELAGRRVATAIGVPY